MGLPTAFPVSYTHLDVYKRQEAVCLSVEGPLKILGPSVVPLRGGMAGTYLATTGEAGRAVLHCRMEGALDTEAVLTVRSREEQNV